MGFYRLWGAQTQRSLQNFDIGGEHEQMPEPIIRSFGVLKKCAAKVYLLFPLCLNLLAVKSITWISEACYLDLLFDLVLM